MASSYPALTPSKEETMKKTEGRKVKKSWIKETGGINFVE